MLGLELWAEYYLYQQQALLAVARASLCHCSGRHVGKFHPTTATHCHLQAPSSTTANVDKAVLLSQTIVLATAFAAIAGMRMARMRRSSFFDAGIDLLASGGVALLRK